MILKKPLEEREAFCTPENLLTLQFLIAEDRSNYYSELKSKDDIDSVVPSFPTSYLGAVVEEARRGILHRPAQFPAAWRQGRPAEEDMTIGEQYGFGRALFPPPGSPPKFGEDETQTAASARGYHNHVISEFKPLAKKVQKAIGPNGFIPMGDACKKIGKEIKDLPQQNATDPKSKKKGLCYKFLLGKCGQGGRCRNLHVNKLPKEVIEEIQPTLIELTDAIVSMDPKSHTVVLGPIRAYAPACSMQCWLSAWLICRSCFLLFWGACS